MKKQIAATLIALTAASTAFAQIDIGQAGKTSIDQSKTLAIAKEIVAYNANVAGYAATCGIGEKEVRKIASNTYVTLILLDQTPREIENHRARFNRTALQITIDAKEKPVPKENCDKIKSEFPKIIRDIEAFNRDIAKAQKTAEASQ
ncbi:MAG: hypothetical protein Q4A11_04815 [Brachymonas sp.]|nr:hypothetical protein [Brachymonas sp.]